MDATPVIGVDFDNTLVCYDRLFQAVCREKRLIGAEFPADKTGIRNHLRRQGREEDWTEIQGIVYGARMREAEPFPGVIRFFKEARRSGARLIIISHKTRHPFRGESHDLHAAARDWLDRQGFLDPDRGGLTPDDIHFEPTREAKLDRIREEKCSHFIDDLPEFLAEAAFPAGIRRILFDPNDRYPEDSRWTRVGSWTVLRERILERA